MKLSWKIFFVVCLLLVALVLWAAMGRNGAKTALEDYHKQLAARGEKLSVEQLAPHVTPEEQDAGLELVAEAARLGGTYKDSAPAMIMVAPGRAAVTWNQEVWPTTESSNVWPGLRQEVLIHSNALELFRAALKQPLGAVRLDYTQGWTLPLPYLAHLKRAAIELLAASRLELHDGKVDESLADLKACIIFTHFSEHEPIMISQLVRVAIINIAFQNTWEVLQHPGLNDSQLAALQHAWESAGVISNSPPIFEMERAMNAISFDKARKGDLDARGLVPVSVSRNQFQNSFFDPLNKLGQWVDELRYTMWKRRWSYDEELCVAQICQGGMEAMRDMQSNAPYVARLKKMDSESDKVFNSFTNVSRNFILGYQSGFSHNYLRKLAVTDTARELAVTAIALKRYEIAHQHFPANLDELIPDFLPAIPIDPMDGKPLRYRPNPDGTFLLYSIGDDGVDDGGDPNLPKYLSTNHIYWNWTAGHDIVWPMSASRKETDVFKKQAMDDWISKHPVWKTNQVRK